MLAANLPVCQYAAMLGQNNGQGNSSSPSNHSNNNSNNNCNNNGVNNPINIGGVGVVGGGTSAAAAKNQLEQLNTMREALFSQDGWGCQHVNQDTNWEVPSSPEPSNKDSSGGPPMWKPNINNGTDLWESNLRNGGQPPSQPVQKTPWGHTPSSNLGGTWGEDDDGADSSNVWSGTSNSANTSGVSVAAGGPQVGSGPQWGQSSVGVPSGSGGNTSVVTASNIGTNGSSACIAGTGSAGNVNVPGGASVASANNGGNGWGDPRDIRSGPMVPIDLRTVDPRDAMRSSSSGDPRDLRMIDPRDPIRGDPRGISGRLNGSSEMWGQHHTVSHGQLSLSKMVGPGGNPAVNVTIASVAGGMNASNISGGNNGNAQWGATQSVVGPKDIASITGKQPSGWEEPSPPPQRRNIPNYDDGTSLWGQQSRVPGGGSHWKEMSEPLNRSHLIRSAIVSQNATNTGVGGLSVGGSSGLGVSGNVSVTGNPNNPVGGVGPQGRLNVGSAVGPAVSGQLKPDGAMWIHAGAAGANVRNTGSWGDDGNHSVVTGSSASWGEDKSVSGINQLGAGVGVVGGNAWPDSSAVASWVKNPTKISSSSGGWGSSSVDTNDLSNEWAHVGIVGKSQSKVGSVGLGGMNSDMIKNSKQYRMLVDTGYKKEDVERALISTNMNIEEAADILRTNASMVMESWRRHDESLGSYNDHSNSGGGFQARYPSTGSQPSIQFPSNNNILNNMGNAVVGGGNNSGLATLNSMQPLHVQKYLNQGPHNVAAGPQSINPGTVAFGQGTNLAASAVNAVTNNSGQPSAQQLRMLVQQIQLAVHSGYLSSQILNQPLAPATLLLLNQLLSNIKHLQGAQQSLARGNNATNIQMNVAIAKYKQQIQNLQNQINAQQAIYIKQQNPQQHGCPSHVTNSNADYLRGQHDAINALQGNFSEINLNKSGGYQGTPNQQSRLNQWKLPVLEKEVTSDSTDFSRAPGATKQTLASANANSMGALSMQSDGAWSAGRNIGDGWPDPSNDNESKDWSVGQASSATAYTDLVQEFEPGKPWKGSQIKSIEDDPSITPGSVARSPLAINPTPKEADIFANTSKTSPTDLPPLGLSSTTWSFNPSSSNQNFPSWSDNPQQCTTSELWATPMNKTSRGPPPGLGSNKSGVVHASGVVSVTNPSSVVTGNSNGWIVGGRSHNTNTGWAGTNSSWNSNWLLLKNLTTQIDGSTLRTLCMQHGPLITFHLYLNQGIALCKYATREEANKAQMTLNNCVLGNTTICAESPSENEVQSILQHLPQTSNQSVTPGTGSNGGNSGSSGSNTNSSGGGGGNSSSGGNGPNNNSVVNNTGTIPNPGNVIVNNVSSNANCNNSGGGNTNTGGQIQGIGPGSNINSNSCGGPGSNVVGNGGSAGNANTGPAVWRQTQNQLQNLQNRHTGRETDFDYISKYVCSIVDD